MQIKKILLWIAFFLGFGFGAQAHESHILPWESNTNSIDADFNIVLPFNTSRFEIRCNTANTLQFLHFHPSLALCSAEDLALARAHIALYAINPLFLEKKEAWQEDFEKSFLDQLSDQAVRNLFRDLAPMHIIYESRSEKLEMNCETPYRHDMRSHHLRVEPTVEQTGARVGRTHSMYIAFDFFTHPVSYELSLNGTQRTVAHDMFFVLVVYNRGTTEDIRDDACELFQKMRSRTP